MDGSANLTAMIIPTMASDGQELKKLIHPCPPHLYGAYRIPGTVLGILQYGGAKPPALPSGGFQSGRRGECSPRFCEIREEAKKMGCPEKGPGRGAGKCSPRRPHLRLT